MKNETEGSFYTSVKLFDNTFGINKVALAIANLLEEIELSGFELDEDSRHFYWKVQINSFPFHNGREHGICLMVNNINDRKCLLIVFGENRNSDEIFVDHWITNKPFNSPAVEDFTDKAYNARKSFSYCNIREATDYVKTKIHIHLKEIVKSINKSHKKEVTA